MACIDIGLLGSLGGRNRPLQLTAHKVSKILTDRAYPLDLAGYEI